MDTLNVTGYHHRPSHLVAEYRGFFTNEGLTVKCHEATYAPAHNRGMAEGRWDPTLSSADTMIARTTTDGVDFLLFMQAEEGQSACLIAQPGIRSIDQLRGKLDGFNGIASPRPTRATTARPLSSYRGESDHSQLRRQEAFAMGRLRCKMRASS